MLKLQSALDTINELPEDELNSEGDEQKLRQRQNEDAERERQKTAELIEEARKDLKRLFDNFREKQKEEYLRALMQVPNCECLLRKSLAAQQRERVDKEKELQKLQEKEHQRIRELQRRLPKELQKEQSGDKKQLFGKIKEKPFVWLASKWKAGFMQCLRHPLLIWSIIMLFFMLAIGTFVYVENTAQAFASTQQAAIRGVKPKPKRTQYFKVHNFDIIY